MKNVIAFALSLAVITPAFAQKNNLEDKPKDKKEAEKKHTLTLGFTLGGGPFIKFQTNKDDIKVEHVEGTLIIAVADALPDAHKPKKMVQKKRVVVPAPLIRVTTGQLSAIKVGEPVRIIPSPMHCVDDVQYFPAGPETQLPNARRAHQEYRLQQDAKPNRLKKLNHIVAPAPKSSPDSCQSVFQSSELLQKIWSDMWNEDGVVSGSKVPNGIEYEQPKKLLKFHHLITPTPLPPMPQVIKPAMATVASKTALSCPLCQKAASGNIQQAGFVKAPPAGVIMIQTKITETDKTGKKNVIATPKITTIPGQKATVQTSGPKHGIKLEIVAHPLANNPEQIVIKCVLCKMDKDGKMKVVTSPHIMTKNGMPARVSVARKDNKTIDLEFVADHIILKHQPPKPWSIKSSITTATTKSTTGCPNCQKAAKPTIKKFKIVETPKVGVIVIQTKITETDKSGWKNVIATPKMMTKPGQKASMQIANEKDGIKLEIVVKPMLHHPGHIMVSPVLHKMDKHGKFKVVAKPQIMTKNGLPAKVMIGSKNHKNIEMEIIADHLIFNPQPQPHKVMLRMKSPNVVFGRTAHQMPVPYLSRLPILKELFPPHNADMMDLVMPYNKMPLPASSLRAMSYNAWPKVMMQMKPVAANNKITHITQKNQMCESCKTAAIAKCSCCGKPMASNAMMPNIMQAGFAKVSDKTMTVKVYPLKKYFKGDALDGLDSEITEIKSFVKIVQSSVEPDSWQAAGGKGTIDFTLLGLSFVVRQNEKAHLEIEKLLTDLGKAMTEALSENE